MVLILKNVLFEKWTPMMKLIWLIIFSIQNREVVLNYLENIFSCLSDKENQDEFSILGNYEGLSVKVSFCVHIYGALIFYAYIDPALMLQPYTSHYEMGVDLGPAGAPLPLKRTMELSHAMNKGIINYLYVT